MKKLLRAFGLVLAATLSTLFSGCEDFDPTDHEPEDGYGALVVNNHLVHDLIVYVDGVQLEDTNDNDDHAYDLAPGLHRVILDERNGNGTFRDDIDIIEGRNTVLDVTEHPYDSSRLDVAIFFKTP